MDPNITTMVCRARITVFGGVSENPFDIWTDRCMKIRSYRDARTHIKSYPSFYQIVQKMYERNRCDQKEVHGKEIQIVCRSLVFFSFFSINIHHSIAMIKEKEKKLGRKGMFHSRFHFRKQLTNGVTFARKKRRVGTVW